MSYRGLGFDPVPGRLADVDHAIGQFGSAADGLAGVGQAVRDAVRHSDAWRGPSAEAFRVRAEATGRAAVTGERALRAAATVLTRWAGTLARHQRHAEDLDAAALRLRADLRAAHDDVQDRQNALDLAATPPAAARATTELTAARARAATLDQALADVLSNAETLARDHERAAEATAAALRPGTAAPVGPRTVPAHALAAVLHTASATSATLAATLAGPLAARVTDVPAGAAAAFTRAMADPGPVGGGHPGSRVRDVPTGASGRAGAGVRGTLGGFDRQGRAGRAAGAVGDGHRRAGRAGDSVADDHGRVGGSVADGQWRASGSAADGHGPGGGSVADGHGSGAGSAADGHGRVGGSVADGHGRGAGSAADGHGRVGGSAADDHGSVGGSVADGHGPAGGAVADDHGRGAGPGPAGGSVADGFVDGPAGVGLDHVRGAAGGRAGEVPVEVGGAFGQASPSGGRRPADTDTDTGADAFGREPVGAVGRVWVSGEAIVVGEGGR